MLLSTFTGFHFVNTTSPCVYENDLETAGERERERLSHVEFNAMGQNGKIAFPIRNLILIIED